MGEKPNFAFYWAASCGGCEIAVLDTDEKILELRERANIRFWPAIMDIKYEDLRKVPAGEFDVSFINGAVRNSEQEEIVRLLREKSKYVVAFGSCACYGGIPALANLSDRETLLRRVYQDSSSTLNPLQVRPEAVTTVPEGRLELPALYEGVYRLGDVIDVDYYLPGCPPPVRLINETFDRMLNGRPEPGAVLAPDKTVCEECQREKDQKKLKGYTRLFSAIPDPKKCLLEQGIVCCGPATRGGCDARCPAVGAPCRGCMGPVEGITDHGVRLAEAVMTVIDPSISGEELRRIVEEVVDPVGTFYRFSFSGPAVKARKHGEAK